MPAIDLKADPLALPAYEVLRIGFEALRIRLSIPTSFKKLLERLDDAAMGVDAGFEDAIEKVGKLAKDDLSVQHIFLEQVRDRLNDAIKEVATQITVARKLHSKQFLIYSTELPQIDHDIFFKCLLANGWLNELMFDREGKRVRDIEDFGEALTPIYSRLRVLERLQPSSPLFALGILNVEISGHQSAWEKTEVKISPQAFVKEIGNHFSLIESTSSCEVYSPSETLDQVMLPEKAKAHITSLCQHYQKILQTKQNKKLTFLFKGPPGTGKSMTAKAIARKLGLNVLKVDFPNVSDKAIPKTIAFFAERAKAGNCMLLFDECEDLIGYNPFIGKSDGWMKVFFESFAGVAVFTTNYWVPKGFERRMSYSLDFKEPNAKIRTEILKAELTRLAGDQGLQAIPDDRILSDIASQHPLSGGYYQQVLQLAAAQSAPGTIEVQALRESFQHCELQQNRSESDSVREPRVSLDKIHLDSDHKLEIANFIQYSREVLSGGVTHSLMPPGATGLFSGPPGTGKTITAEAIATEIGIPFRRVSPSTFLSKWVGDTEAAIKEVFKDAEREKYLLFIDEAEGLFLDRAGTTKSWEKTQVDELLQQVEAFKGVLIIATNFKEMMDQAFARRFLFHVNFRIPSVETRQSLWSAWKDALSLTDENIFRLSSRFALTGGEIRNAAVRAKVNSKTELKDLSALCEEVIRGRTGQRARRLGV